MTQGDKTGPRRWPDFRAVWRWHFYAGLLCLPFVCFLALTGSIYLFKPQIEGWLDRPYDSLPGIQTASSARAVAAVLDANPGWTLHAYELPRTPQAAARVLIGRAGEERRVYVDRGPLRILANVREEQRPMRVLFHLHGELLQGDRGSMVVELAASWTIVMVITGLWLWWPRQAVGLAGVVYPRLGAGRRLFWRDLHAVTGLWISLFVLLLLISGLPWAKNWGSYLKEVRRITGTAAAHQDWTNGRSSEIAANQAMDMAGMAGMAGMSDMAPARPAAEGRLTPEAFAPLDRIARTVAALDLPPPVLISPPKTPGGLWSAKSDAQNRPLRVDLKLSSSGAVMSRTDFAQRGLIDRIVGVGVAAHEGQLFGWANQLLGLTVAAGLVTLSVSAVVLWWRRRTVGVLGAPTPQGDPRFSIGLALTIGLLGVLLPEFGLSLIVVAVVERLILRRLPGVGPWLGLGPACT